MVRMTELELQSALTTSQVADRLGVSSETIRRAVTAGQIRPVFKLPGPRGIYLFSPAEVERYIARVAEVEEATRRLNDAV